jgi:hypothetical protein
MINRRVVFALALLAISASAAAADPAERKFIRQGMSEGEVLMKVGKPDSESMDSGGGAQVTVKRWIYLPASGDQQTITTVVFQNGKVTDVERKVSF